MERVGDKQPLVSLRACFVNRLSSLQLALGDGLFNLDTARETDAVLLLMHDLQCFSPVPHLTTFALPANFSLTFLWTALVPVEDRCCLAPLSKQLPGTGLFCQHCKEGAFFLPNRRLIQCGKCFLQLGTSS